MMLVTGDEDAATHGDSPELMTGGQILRHGAHRGGPITGSSPAGEPREYCEHGPVSTTGMRLFRLSTVTERGAGQPCPGGASYRREAAVSYHYRPRSLRRQLRADRTGQPRDDQVVSTA